MTAALTGVIGALATILLYRQIASDWPREYASVRSVADGWSRRSLPAFTLFRTLPVAVIALLTLRISGTDPTLYFRLTFATVLVSATDGIATLRLARRGILRRARLALLHLYGALCSCAAIFGAAVLASRVLEWMPNAHDMVEDVWFGLVVGLVAFTVRGLLGQPTPTYSRDALLEGVPAHLMQECFDSAADEDTDATLLLSLVLAESEQRPAWIRTIERRLAFGRKGGTFGIAQVQGGAGMSDMESVRILARQHGGFHLANWPLHSRWLRLAVEVERHSRDPEFVQLVVRYCRLIATDFAQWSTGVAPDGLPCITADDPQRHRNVVRLSGTSWTPEIAVIHSRDRARVRNCSDSSSLPVIWNPKIRRWDWQLFISLEDESVTLRAGAEELNMWIHLYE